MKRVAFVLILCMSLKTYADVSPAAVGWGNLIVPGLGATLRDEPTRGLLEATAEIGLFYGGTFGVAESGFSIDSTIDRYNRGVGLGRSLMGEGLQQIGIKLHMYNTFYNYQQANLALKDSMKNYSPQPLYLGDAIDGLIAPFQWKYLSDPWVYGLLIASTALQFVLYQTTTLTPNNPHASGFEDNLYAFNTMLLVPMGSAWGEEPLFRGMMQREFWAYTDSFLAANLMQATIFMLLHPTENKIPAFLGGLYFGYLARKFHGDLGPSMAAHFWVDFVSGVFDYYAFRRAAGKSTPFGPPVQFMFSMPLTF